MGLSIAKENCDLAQAYPDVKKTSSGFEVSRLMVDFFGGEPRVIVLKESLTESGTYRLLSETPVTRGPLARAKWEWPYYTASDRDPFVGVLPYLPTTSGTTLRVGIAYWWIGSGEHESVVVVSVDGHKDRIARRPSDLDGVFQIENLEDALQVVRLYTTVPGRSWIMGFGHEIELCPMNRVGLRNAFGSVPVLRTLMNAPARWGLVTDEEESLAAAQYPIVRRSGDDFIITRALLLGELEERFPYLVTEKISRSGSYKLLSRKRITTGPLSRIKWRYPAIP